MNLLKSALPAVTNLIKRESILITNEKLVNNRGVVETIKETFATQAHIQPLNPSEISKLTQGTIDSPNIYAVWIIGNLAQVLSSISRTNCIIEWNGNFFEVYSKEDWSQNGWICVYITQKESVENG